jgi:hypothetical protein
MKLSCLLTQWKRNHLKDQLKSVYSQTLQPDYVIVFQNENHADISDLKKEYNFIHVKSDYNTKHFGRFTYCINLPVEHFIIMDDDILPGPKCFENYINQLVKLNSIIGGNGRFADVNQNGTDRNGMPYPRLHDVGVRKLAECDFVGHLWCFKKKWLYNMFSIEPYTLETSEDMHFSFSNKVRENIKCYVAEQLTMEESCDLKMNAWSSDQHSSCKKTSRSLRQDVVKHFIKNYDLKHL